jgi:FKBP-type peptidyl-prolyl cis-trans isomerase SlyD
MSDEEETNVAEEPEDAAEAADTADADAAEAAEEEAAEAEDEDGLGEGDFVRLAYTARTVEDERLVDTTDPEVAEESEIDTEDQTFEPRVLALGGGQLFEAVEEAIYGGEVGDTGTVVVPAAEAFGEYDPDEVRTISADRVEEDSRYPGAPVEIDGERGHVETIVGGRARVDFNHPLAGDDIEYEYEILDVVEDRIEQAQGLLDAYFDVDLDMRIETEEVEEEVTVEGEDGEETETELVEQESLYIDSDPQLQFNQQWMFSKQQIAQDIIDRLGVDRVVIQEVIEGGAAGPMGMGGMGMGGLGDELDEEVSAEELVEELDADEE